MKKWVILFLLILASCRPVVRPQAAKPESVTKMKAMEVPAKPQRQKTNHEKRFIVLEKTWARFDPNASIVNFRDYALMTNGWRLYNKMKILRLSLQVNDNDTLKIFCKEYWMREKKDL
jgi:hypothetical protein